MPKDLTHRLAIFLLKDSLASPDHAIDKTDARQEVVSCGAVAATLYYRQANAHPPGWAKFFAGDPVHKKLQTLKVASNGAALLVPAGGRHFACVRSPDRTRPRRPYGRRARYSPRPFGPAAPPG